MNIEVFSDMAHSAMCWVILATALFCYHRMALQWMAGELHARKEDQITRTLTSALPLLGLLGTIMGLLGCFKAMSAGATGVTLFSAGIGDALLTTQLGLLCAIPAWILQHLPQRALARQES